MRVLHAATHEHTGAGRAAVRTHAAVAKAGLESELLVLHGSGAAPGVEVLAGPVRALLADVQWRAERALLSLQKSGDGVYRSLGLASPGFNRIRAKNPDLVHLHWIPGLLSVADLPFLGKPVVWTFHDQWPICGAEHYTDLPRPRDGYTAENRRPGASGPDLDRGIWERKRRHWRDFAPLVVCSSRWMAAEVRASRLFGSREVHVIPNPLDTSLYLPQDRAAARAALGLPAARTLLLFGAWEARTDRRKGFEVLVAALALLPELAASTDVVVLGATGSEPLHGFTTHWLGFRDEATLRQLYSACDVLAMPSLQDNLPNILAEGMACGLPAVGSETGGIPDLIRHGHNGLLAAPGNARQLADGLEKLIGNNSQRLAFSVQARRDIEQLCDERAIGARYSELYRAAAASYSAR